ncbi:MAG: DUF4974 domain-containing protein [Chitinophagaceae bacterium]
MDAEQEKRLAYLAEQWVRGTITPEEAAEYAAWYNQDDGAPLPVPAEFASDKAQQEKRIWKSILQNRQYPVWHLATWYKVAAVIAVLILLSGGIFWFASRHSDTVVVHADKKHTGNDVLPGTNGAVLTLANGQQILLDSAGNGTLAQQGGTTVSNANGTLVYAQKDGQQALLYNTLSTARGQQFPLTLSDGSKVWLNAESSIRFPVAFQGKERSVEISGEAYFEVVHNARQPFVVHKLADNTTIQVLGTHFNVNGYPEEQNTRVTLLEGLVQVTKGSEKELLHPGWQAKIAYKDGKMTQEKADLEAVMAWKNGYFSFDNTDLATVMRQLARWYDMDVVYRNGKVPDMTFWGGISRNSNLSEVLKVLEESNIRFKVEGRRLEVY